MSRESYYSPTGHMWKTADTDPDRRPADSIKAVKVFNTSNEYLFAYDVRDSHGERLGALVVRAKSNAPSISGRLEILNCAEFVKAEIEA